MNISFDLTIFPNGDTEGVITRAGDESFVPTEEQLSMVELLFQAVGSTGNLATGVAHSADDLEAVKADVRARAHRHDN